MDFLRMFFKIEFLRRYLDCFSQEEILTVSLLVYATHLGTYQMPTAISYGFINFSSL